MIGIAGSSNRHLRFGLLGANLLLWQWCGQATRATFLLRPWTFKSPQK